MNIIDELTWRGAINQQTDEKICMNFVRIRVFHCTVV